MTVRDRPANGTYRRDVERLLEQIRTLVREVGRLQRAGAGAGGRELEERKSELDRARRRLATLISHRLGEEYRSAA